MQYSCNINITALANQLRITSLP